MSRSLPPAVFAALVLWLALVGSEPAAAQPAKGPPHVDHEGNPLPKEAVARLGSARLRTGGIIRGLGYSADGKTIVSTSTDDTLRWWDAGTGKPLRRVDTKVPSVS